MFDLNLLRVLAAVIEQKTVTAAAERLQLTQPAITHSLNRLRKIVQDELFVKDGRGVAPTRTALLLYQDTVELVARAETVVARVSRFDPMTTTATFRIALTDIGQMVFLPVVVKAMRVQAPEARLEVLNVDSTTVVDQLTTGELDAAILSIGLGSQVRSEVLHHDQYLCLARRGLFSPPGPGVAELNRHPRVALPGSTGHTLVEGHLAEPPAGSIVLGSFNSIPALVSTTDLIAFVPKVVVRDWERDWPVEAWELRDISADTEVRAHLPKAPLSRASAWFGKLIVTELRGLSFSYQ